MIAQILPMSCKCRSNATAWSADALEIPQKMYSEINTAKTVISRIELVPLAISMYVPAIFGLFAFDLISFKQIWASNDELPMNGDDRYC